MIEPLVACPACGETTDLRYEFSGSCGFVQCGECDATGPLDDRAADPICDVDAALKAWNLRNPIEGGCSWCGCVTNLHREGQDGERIHCGECDACWAFDAQRSS
jgi:ssDNA-binding Zn-finger/Zn-ribbon topoisomerase 1